MRFRAGQRLRRTGEFRAVREEGRRIDCGAFLLTWRRCDPAEASRPARLGVVASRAAVGNAVCRNRAKRRLRALFRQHQEMLPPGIDIVLLARGAILRVAYPEAKARLTDACQRIRAAVIPHA